jgi:hypothetical protein
MRRDSKRGQLGLKKETLRALTGDQMAQAAGGSMVAPPTAAIVTTGASLGGSAKCTYTD